MKKNGKKNRKIVQMIGILMTFCIMLTGCGGSSKSESSVEFTTSETGEAYGMTSDTAEKMDMDNGEIEQPAEAEQEELSSGTEVTTGAAQKDVQKLIKNVYMNVETKNFDSLLNNLSDKISELGGYIEGSQINGDSYNYENSRYAYLTIRIPCDKLDSFVKIVDKSANITNKTEDTQDVTLQYVDMSSHVSALRAEQESLLKILEAATKVEDIIKIQSQLTEVRYEIESYESQLRTYDNLVSYSTVTLDINEVQRETTTETKTVGEEIQARLSANLYNIGQGFLDFVIWFVSSLPYLIIWAIIIVILVLLCRKILPSINRKRRERKEKKKAKKTQLKTTAPVLDNLATEDKKEEDEK